MVAESLSGPALLPDYDDSHHLPDRDLPGPGPLYQYRSAQSLTVLNDAAPVYFFEEYRTSYPYYTGQTAYWTAPADYDENARLRRDAVWAKKHVYPTASEDQVLSSLNQHQNLTLVVPEGNIKIIKPRNFSA